MEISDGLVLDYSITSSLVQTRPHEKNLNKFIITFLNRVVFDVIYKVVKYVWNCGYFQYWMVTRIRHRQKNAGAK